jgi:hypothetical protein
MLAVSAPVANENHNSRVKKQKVIIDTMTEFMRLVLRAGLLLPSSVGSIDGKNAN